MVQKNEKTFPSPKPISFSSVSFFQSNEKRLVSIEIMHRGAIFLPFYETSLEKLWSKNIENEMRCDAMLRHVFVFSSRFGTADEKKIEFFLPKCRDHETTVLFWQVGPGRCCSFLSPLTLRTASEAAALTIDVQFYMKSSNGQFHPKERLRGGPTDVYNKTATATASKYT